MDTQNASLVTEPQMPLQGDDSEPMFQFDLRDDLAEEGAPLGYAGGVVTLLLDTEKLTGIALSPDAARRVGMALIECAVLAEREEEDPSTEGS